MAAKKDRPVECFGLSGSTRAYTLARLFRETRQSVLVIVPDKKQAKTLCSDLEFFLHDMPKSGPDKLWDSHIVEFPSYHILGFKGISFHCETAARRITTLYRLLNLQSPVIVVTTAQAAMARLIPVKALAGFAELVMAGEDLDRDAFVQKLISGGYVSGIVVEEPGDFCVRGAIVDVFGPPYENPLRIEFNGDQVESIRFFSPATQRTIKKIKEAYVLPASEAVCDPARMTKIIHNIRERAVLAGMPVTKIRKLVEDMKNGSTFPGIEAFVPLLYKNGPSTLFDYLSDDILCVAVEPSGIKKAATDYLASVEENYEQALFDNRLCIPASMTHISVSRLEDNILKSRPVSFRNIPVVTDLDKPKDTIRCEFYVSENTELVMSLASSKHRDRLLKPLAGWIEGQSADIGCAVVAACGTKAQAQRLKSLLAPYGVGLSQNKKWMTKPDKGPQIAQGALSSGFVWPEESLSIVTESEIFGPKHRQKKVSASRPRTELLNLTELKQGDFVVHVDHGIARYNGLVKIEHDRVSNDFLLLEYKDNDKLYLPVDRTNLIQKYRTVGKATPVLEKLGGKAWDRVKKRVKKSVEKIAGELLRIYALRKVKKGYAFSAADSYFSEFEAGFEYEETPDQARAIADVLADMESSLPMDRLVCGDVGYGKTEVALRASFKAVSDSKQVAFVAPTTILSEQHYQTFKKRYAGYPVNIACLNRFRTAKEKKEILLGLEQGSIDIVIGTHSVLQKNVAFKDLCLVLIDEEQRFGVRHKEILKKARATVDVLVLTATPIPRTLHLSMTGIRDISVINTPPEHRRPITTYVSKFDDAIAAEAIKRELSRKGQIFFVHNRVQTIDAMARRLQKLVPEARIGVAHGQLSVPRLEKMMMRFVSKEIDMLVCTAIIESGLDIPAANTILINRADMFGLAQMYQLRGRVGRGDDQAYAYLFIPDESILTRNAQRRLKVLMEHSDLGAGFAIAMNDLQIRGGGSILGSAQSGQIAAVGYELYLQFMEKAIGELKGQDTTPSLEPEINVDFSAYIPKWYIPDVDQRLLAYRRLSRLTESSEVGAFSQEMKDRFGRTPPETSQLFYKIMLKILCRDAGIKRLDMAGKSLNLAVSSQHQTRADQLLTMVRENHAKFRLTPDSILKISLDSNGIKARTIGAKNILKEIAMRVN